MLAVADTNSIRTVVLVFGLFSTVRELAAARTSQWMSSQGRGIVSHESVKLLHF